MFSVCSPYLLTCGSFIFKEFFTSGNTFAFAGIFESCRNRVIPAAEQSTGSPALGTRCPCSTNEPTTVPRGWDLPKNTQEGQLGWENVPAQGTGQEGWYMASERTHCAWSLLWRAGDWGDGRHRMDCPCVREQAAWVKQELLNGRCVWLRCVGASRGVWVLDTDMASSAMQMDREHVYWEENSLARDGQNS